MAVLINGTNGLIQAYDYQTPSTGFSYTFAAGTQTLVLNPSTTLATGTITMPPNPSDGMTITISSTKQITALTLSGNTGQTIVGGVSYLPANTAVAYVYRSSNTSWFPFETVPLLEAQPIGYGQTWQSLTGSRANNTTYTNSTGRPIMVAVGFTWTNSIGWTLTINGVTTSAPASNVSQTSPGMITFIVPSGGTYLFASNAMSTWSELR